MKKLLVLLLLAAFLPVLSGKTVTLKLVPGKTDYTVTVPSTGIYWIRSSAVSHIPVGVQHFAQIRLDDGFLLTRRVLPYNYPKADSSLERVKLEAGKKHRLFISFDSKTTTVSQLQFIPQRPYPVPKAARNYRPKLLPPKHHPRLFVNPQYLKELRQNLVLGDNLPVWKQVRKTALTPYRFVISKDKEISYDANLLAAVDAKAFYHLVTGDKKIGRQAADLIQSYLQHASFGNGQDICRKVGEMIFSASLVYDWCYSLLSDREKVLIRERMLFYAAELEAAWPPFRQYASAGHGNEAQFNRDLFSMALAIYDEDPQPYSYVAWQMFEIWLPLKQNTYLSGRHSQGSAYGLYRAQFDFIAALQIWRMSGIKVLPEEAKDLPLYWYYLRLPDGTFLIEGDDNWKIKRPQYVPISPILLNFLLAIYPNPDYKMELIRGRKLSKPFSPVLFLLANDPGLKPADTRASLPLTRLYKDPLPGMAIRTGWNFTPDSDDMILSIIGGNRHLINHQHGDLGSFQVHYRETLIADIGQYRYYNVPYDRFLNKTAAVHSMMRFVDPAEKAPAGAKQWVNAGGQYYPGERPPLTLKSFLTDPRFYRGETPRAGFGPSQTKPVFNFLEMDLSPAYRGRVKSYSRSFVFWNQNNKNRPGTLLIFDRFTGAGKNIEPVFQLTSIIKPVIENGRLIIKSKGKKSGCVTVLPLLPEQSNIKILTGKDSRTFGKNHIPPRFPERKEAGGSRIEFTGNGNEFLNILQIHDGKLSPQPVRFTRSGKRLQVVLEDEKYHYLTNLGDVAQVTSKAFNVEIKRDRTQVLLLDLSPGKWQALCGKEKRLFEVTEKQGCIYGIFTKGLWQFNPVQP